MNEYYLRYKKKDPQKELNDRYPMLLQDDGVFEEVIGIANAAFYNRIAWMVKGYESADWELVDDILQEAALRLSRLRGEKLEESGVKLDFYFYAKNVYENVAREILKKTDTKKKRLALESIEGRMERSRENEKSGNDSEPHYRYEDTVKYDPQTLVHEKEEKDEMLGRLLFQTLAQTDAVPHMAVAFCYSVCLPPMLRAHLAVTGGVSDEERLYYLDKYKMERNSNILVECAKVLMGEDTVGEMSSKFADAYNKDCFFEETFQWGEVYRKNLQADYHDNRHNIHIPKEETLVFVRFFSAPSDGGEAKEGWDYLGRNIRNFSTRMRTKLLKDVLKQQEIQNPDMQISQSAVYKLKEACKKSGI